MGGDHSLAGMVARPTLLTELGRSRYFNTTGGTAVSCAVGKAVLEEIENEALMENAHRVGNYLKDEIRSLANRHAVIGDVRGAGLFIGVEVVTDAKTLQPAQDIANQIVNALPPSNSDAFTQNVMREIFAIDGRAARRNLRHPGFR